MGNLIVKNSAGSVAIVEIEVRQNGRIIANPPNLSIPNGHSSAAIPLNAGVYDVTVKVKDMGGTITSITERIVIEQDEDSTLEIYQAPPEEKVLIRPILVKG